MGLASLIGVIAGVRLVLGSILMNSALDLFINIPLMKEVPLLRFLIQFCFQ
jgi:hypothetical protein